MQESKNLRIRLVLYFIGLFVMTLGISLSVKSNLGVSPVSSIPYTITCVFGLEMGKATILFHAALVVLQILILRRNFELKNLLQIAVGIVFGYFTTFSNYLFSFLPTPENMLVRILMILGSTVLIAIGIFFYLPANIVPLAGEGVTKTISDIRNMELSKVKVAFDVTVVTVSLLTCVIVLHTPGSVGLGTIAAAVLVGTILGQLNQSFGKERDVLLGITRGGKTAEKVA